jgi:predicted transcriptional regulator
MYMKRTTVFVPEAVERELQGLARRERKPVAWFVREALTEYVAARRPAAALPSFTGIGASGDMDTAERHEELLWNAPHGNARAPRTSARAPKRGAKKR